MRRIRATGRRWTLAVVAAGVSLIAASASVAGPANIAASAATPAAAVIYNSRVATMVNNVTRAQLEPSVNEFSGEAPTVVGGVTQTLTTRAEASGAHIDLAEQWVYEHLSSYGLSSVAYQTYPGRGVVSPGRNIIGQITGSVTPGNVIIIGCHIDDRPWYSTSTIAYGADDDASGCSALLYLARTFAGHTFASTIRFAFFNAEENGSWSTSSWGAGYYAAQAKAAGENIVAMIDADSLAWNPVNNGIVYMVTRKSTKDPGGGDHAIVTMWQQAVTAYSITGISPLLQASGDNLDDHGAFWAKGYPAVMLIEDDVSEVSPNWEQLTDRVSTFNWPYYVQITKSLVAVAAHEAGFVS